MNKKKPGGELEGACCGGRVIDQLPTKLFKALCDPTRVSLLGELLGRGGEPQSVGEVATCCPIDISVVSRHLAQLREAGVVVAERRGKQVYYAVRAQELVRTLRGLADAIEACCPPPSEAKQPKRRTSRSKGKDDE